MIFAHKNGIWIQRPWIDALSYSAGTGSELILRMKLAGMLGNDRQFVVLNANPGMERKQSLEFVRRAKADCEKVGVPFLTVTRSLYAEFLALKASGAKRFDTPPFWTKNRETGKRGRLLQGCTGAYKVAPMYRALREWMAASLGVPADRTDLGTNSVNMLIGFTQDEWHRIKEDKREYVAMQYPLIEAKINRQRAMEIYRENGWPIPPRSVCNGCYANDVAFFREMHATAPEDFEQACQFDDAARDLRQIGVKDECFVSWTLIPLRQLAAMGFPEIDGEREAVACHSGHCFT